MPITISPIHPSAPRTTSPLLGVFAPWQEPAASAASSRCLSLCSRWRCRSQRCCRPMPQHRPAMMPRVRPHVRSRRLAIGPTPPPTPTSRLSPTSRCSKTRPSGWNVGPRCSKSGSTSFAVTSSRSAIARFATSGAKGIPLLTGLQAPKDQVQADVLVDVVTNAGSSSIDEFEAAQKEFDRAARRTRPSATGDRGSAGVVRPVAGGGRSGSGSPSSRSKSSGSPTRRSARRSPSNRPPT